MAYGDPGQAGTVQAGDPGHQSAGGIAGLFGGEVRKAQGPNAGAYDEQRRIANNYGSAYGDQSLNYTQNAPTIANQYQDESRTNIGTNVGREVALADELRNNNGEASKAQFQQGLDSGIAAQLATANSAGGGAVARAGAMRNAAQTGSLMRAGGAATAAELGAREREAARAQAAGIYGNIGGQLQGQYGLEQGSAIEQARLASVNQAQQNQMRLGYGGLGVSSRGQGLDALNGYTSGNLAAQGLSNDIRHNDAQDTNQLVGTGAGVAGAALLAAKGGAIPAGHPVITGEQGQELVLPNHNMAAMYGQSPNAQRKEVTLADALEGIEHLKKRVMQLEGRHG